MGLGCPKFFLGEFGTFLKNRKIFKFFSPWIEHFLKGFWNFLPQNGLKMAKSEPSLVYGKPWKTQILRKFHFLKAVMVLGCPKCILRKFRIFLKNSQFFSFFHHSLAILCKGFETFRPKMSSKWPNLVYEKPWKTHILRKFRFLKAVMILGCPKCILRKVRIFLRYF